MGRAGDGTQARLPRCLLGFLVLGYSSDLYLVRALKTGFRRTEEDSVRPWPGTHVYEVMHPVFTGCE